MEGVQKKDIKGCQKYLKLVDLVQHLVIYQHFAQLGFGNNKKTLRCNDEVQQW
jgi:hypothetical protein